MIVNLCISKHFIMLSFCCR